MTVIFVCILVDNEGDPLGGVFVLREPEDRYLSEVAETIQKKMTDIQVPAEHITFWKPNTPIPESSLPELSRRIKALDLNVTGNVRDAMLLRRSAQLGSVFPPHLSLPPRHIHVIAQLGITTVPIQLPLRDRTPLEIDAINDLVAKELNSLREEVEDFLKSPNPPIWVPPESATPSDREFYTRLEIPTYRNGDPSLLFHDLHLFDVEKIKKMYKRGRHLCICNTSGPGKTRRMLELLITYWGFYFVAIPDVNGVGIEDLREVLLELTLNPSWVADLQENPENRVNQNRINIGIASLPLRRALAARIAVFKLFIELAVKADGKLLEKHKHSWLLFQVAYHLDQVPHPIVRIMKNCFGEASNRALDAWIARLGHIRITHKPSMDDFIIGLDESQRAVRLHPCPFLSFTNNNTFRSILREIVRILIIQPTTLFVSGTGVTMEELQDAVGSGVSKPAGAELFHELGMFNTWPSLLAFLERYLPPSFLATGSGIHLQRRIQEYLLGRYRFIVTFLEYLLKDGLRSPHKLLSEYIKAHTLCDLGDTGFDHASYEPDLQFKVLILSFEWDRLRADRKTLNEAVLIVQSHVTLGKSPTFGPVSVRLVEYGLARLRDDGNHYGQIVEPLAFLSLLQWLEGQSELNLTANLQLRLGSESSRGSAYEEVVILFLLRVMRHEVPFTSVFNFHGTPPPWTNDKAQIVGYLNGVPLAVDVLGDESQNPALAVVQSADNMDAITEWIERRSPNGTPAVLVPTHLFGPDVLIWCGDVLLIGQAKSCVTGNKGTLDADTTSKALDSLHQNHWFKVSRKNDVDQFQRLVDAINAKRVIRFVTGYPLPPNLGSTAPSVCAAIAARGDNPLATINVDTFRAYFIDKNQSYIIKTLDHALDTHRKAEQEKKADAEKQKAYDMDSGGTLKVKREAGKQKVAAKKQKK